MNVEEGSLFWLYIVSMVCVGLCVGWSINRAGNILPRDWLQLGQGVRCCRAHQRAIASTEMRFFAYLLHQIGFARLCRSCLFQGVPVVELVTGCLFGFVSYHFAASLSTAVLLIYVSVLVLISKIDMKNRLVPNMVVYPGMVLVLLLFPISPLASDQGSGELYLNSIEGAVAGFLILLFIYLVFPRGVGAGDVKLGALIGSATGFPLVLGSLALAFVFGGVSALLLVRLKVSTLKDQIPYAPYLAGATVASLLLGGDIFEWYVTLFMG